MGDGLGLAEGKENRIIQRKSIEQMVRIWVAVASASTVPAEARARPGPQRSRPPKELGSFEQTASFAAAADGDRPRSGGRLARLTGASPASDAALAATGKTVAATCKSVPAHVTRSFPGAGSFPAGAGSVPARCKSSPAMAGRSFSGAGSIPAPCKSGAARAGLIPAITGPAAQVAAG